MGRVMPELQVEEAEDEHEDQDDQMLLDELIVETNLHGCSCSCSCYVLDHQNACVDQVASAFHLDAKEDIDVVVRTIPYHLHTFLYSHCYFLVWCLDSYGFAIPFHNHPYQYTFPAQFLDRFPVHLCWSARAPFQGEEG
jgi:hypothetical protein